MDGVRKFPSLKRILFQIHKDLEKVAMEYRPWGSDLTDLEVLIILLEDRRFFQHRGVDWRSVLREFWKMITFRRHGGASTIDMQFVRTRTGFKERTLRRKLYEMLLAYLLQYRMQKIAILRSYLNIVFLGSGMKGLDQGARVAFGKALWELNRSELAAIAAMMVYPRPQHPDQTWSNKVTRRADYGLRLFARYGGRYKQRFE